MSKKFIVWLTLTIALIGGTIWAHTTSTTLGRLQVVWPTLGYDPGAGLETVIHDGITRMADNVNSRYEEFSAIADSTLSTVTHNLGAVFAEYEVLIYTGSGASLVRVQDPAGAGWTIAAGSNPNTQIDVTTPGSGGPHTFAVVVVQGSMPESIDDLDDVDITTSAPGVGEGLVWDGSKFEPGSVGVVSNLITNPDAEVDATGWSVYDDGASATPVDGTGGSPGITITRNTSSPIRETGDFQITKDAADRQGEGASVDLSTLGAAQLQAKLVVEITINSSAAGYADGDMALYFIRDTGGTPTLVTPEVVSIPNASEFVFRSYVDTTTDDDWRLVLHTTSTNATAYNIFFDDVKVFKAHVGNSLASDVRPGLVIQSEEDIFTDIDTVGVNLTTSAVTLSTVTTTFPGTFLMIGNFQCDNGDSNATDVRCNIDLRNDAGLIASNASHITDVGAGTEFTLMSLHVVVTAAAGDTLKMTGRASADSIANGDEVSFSVIPLSKVFP